MERRLAHLEKIVAQQGYVLLVVAVATIFNMAGMLMLWQVDQVPDFDSIAVSLTIFQMTFALAAIFGFWALRGLTKEKAGDVAEEEVRKVVPSLVLRHVQQALDAMRDSGTISDEELSQMVRSLMGKEAEDGNGTPSGSEAR